MKRLTILLVALGLAAAPLAFSTYADAAKNQGGGPGNSGPGDKNSRNEQGHGGQPTG